MKHPMAFSLPTTRPEIRQDYQTSPANLPTATVVSVQNHPPLHISTNGHRDYSHATLPIVRGTPVSAVHSLTQTPTLSIPVAGQPATCLSCGKRYLRCADTTPMSAQYYRCGNCTLLSGKNIIASCTIS